MTRILNLFYWSFSGDIEEFPGIDPIPAYATQIDQTTNEIKINLTANNKQKGNSFTKPLSKSDDANENIVVIIGSGALRLKSIRSIFKSLKRSLGFY